MTAIVSWSGGKDSCLALYRSQQTMRVIGLLTALDETGLKARSHGVSRALLVEQARALGVAITFGSDAHKPEEVGANFAEAVALARGVGFLETLRFERRARRRMSF